MVYGYRKIKTIFFYYYVLHLYTFIEKFKGIPIKEL